ncbi:MAG TPA: OmpA family protein [Desulfuromonadaceae bacterium]|jgi:OOP family OmpA-OmpF porin
MKKLTALILSSAALCIMAAPAVAGEREGAFSISPFVGGYTFDGVQHLETAPVFGLRLGYDLTKNWGVEAVGDYLATDGTRSERSINALSYRLDILYNFMPDGPLVPYLAVGGGGITYGHGSDGLKISNRTTDATVNVGGGLKYFLTDSVALRGDARQLFVLESPSSPKYNWEYTAGLTFLFGGKTAAAPVPVPVQPPPAPVAPTSSLDVAPGSITKGETATLSWTSQNATNCEISPNIGSVKPQGRMSITPSSDTTYNLSCSGQGGTSKSSTNIAVAAPPVPKAPAPTSSLSVNPPSITKGESATLNWTSQNASKCAIQPVIGSVQPQGSMSITPADNTSYTLTCEGAGGVATSAANVAVTVPPPVVVPKAAAKLCSPTVIDIQFDTNKSDIKPQYQDELKTLADFLTEFPNAKGVIEGHTDNVGDKASNMKLSQRRADSVRSYLVKTFGIAPERIKAEGYGPTKPAGDNKTKEGKAKNRRIEANFICE